MLTSYIFCQKGFNKRETYDVKRERFDEKGVSIIDCAGTYPEGGIPTVFCFFPRRQMYTDDDESSFIFPRIL